MVMYLSQC